MEMNLLISNYLSVSDNLIKFYEKYQNDGQEIKNYAEKLKDFKVDVPIVGGFSSGKTSIINSFLGEKVFSVQITPETAIPAEIFFSDPEKIVIKGKNSSHEITKENIIKKEFNFSTDNILIAGLNHERLKNIPSIKIVDMPGLDSGIEAHTKAIDNYIGRSLAYLITVDAESGLRKSIIDFLKELKLFNFPVYVLVTKKDKKSEDIESILKDTESKIKDILGHSNFKIGAVSARKNDIESFSDFMAELQNNSTKIFTDYFTPRLKNKISDIVKYLDMRITNVDKGVEEIEILEKNLITQMEELEIKIKEETNELKTAVSGTINQIENYVSSKLEEITDIIADDIANKRDIKSKVIQIVRNAVIEGIKQQTENKIKKYFRNINNIISNELPLGNFIDPSEFDKMINTDLEKALIDLVSVVAIILGGMFGPLGAAIVAAIAVIAKLVIGKAGEERVKEEKKKLAAEKYRSEIIPDIISKIHYPIQEAIEKYLEDIEKNVESEIASKKKILITSLEDLKKQKLMKEEEFNKTMEELKRDKQTVEDLYNLI